MPSIVTPFWLIRRYIVYNLVHRYWQIDLTKVVPSVLWRCWLGGRKGIRPVKNWVVGCWHGYLSGARCRLAYAQLMPLPLTVSCSSKIQIGFTFLVPAHPGSPGQRAIKRVCVCHKIFSKSGAWTWTVMSGDIAVWMCVWCEVSVSCCVQ